MRCLNAFVVGCTVLVSALPLHAQSLESPLLEYELAPGEAAHRGTASVRIFADGRVQMKRPSYWRQAGTFESRLPRAQLAELLQQVRSLNLAALSPDALAEAHAEETPRHILTEVHDADRVTLIVRELDIERQVTVDAPAAQLERLPNQGALSSLVEIDARLRRLLSTGGNLQGTPADEITP